MAIDPEAPESTVKEYVRRLLRKYGAYWYMPVPSGYGTRGPSDFLCCHQGRALYVETKRAGITKLSPHQEREREKVLTAGGAWMTINARNLEELEDWLHST